MEVTGRSRSDAHHWLGSLATTLAILRLLPRTLSGVPSYRAALPGLRTKLISVLSISRGLALQPEEDPSCAGHPSQTQGTHQVCTHGLEISHVIDHP